VFSMACVLGTSDTVSWDISTPVFLAVVFTAFIMAINLMGFMLMGFDKRQAKKTSQRTPERRFMWLAFLGGAVGVYLGMRTFRHKTRNKQFSIGLPLLILINFLWLYLILQVVQLL